MDLRRTAVPSNDRDEQVEPAVPDSVPVPRKSKSRTLRRIAIFLPLVLVFLLSFAPPAHAAQLKDYCTTNPAEFDLFGCFLSKTIDPLRHALVWVHDGMNTEEPDVFSNFYRGNYVLTLRLGVIITVPMLFVATINAVLKGGRRELLNTYLVGLPVSILGAVAALGLCSVLQKVDQRICDWFWPQLNVDLRTWTNTLLEFDNEAVALINALVMMCLMIAIIVMSWGLYNELVFRILMIYLTLLFLPLALAVWVFESTRKWAIVILEFIIVMIFAKAVMIIIMSFGFHLIVVQFGPNVWTDGRGLSYMLMGLVMFVMAALSIPALISFLLQPRHQPQLGRRVFWQQNQPLNLSKLDMYMTARSYPRRWGGG